MYSIDDPAVVYNQTCTKCNKSVILADPDPRYCTCWHITLDIEMMATKDEAKTSDWDQYAVTWDPRDTRNV